MSHIKTEYRIKVYTPRYSTKTQYLAQYKVVIFGIHLWWSSLSLKEFMTLKDAKLHVLYCKKSVDRIQRNKKNFICVFE